MFNKFLRKYADDLLGEFSPSEILRLPTGVRRKDKVKKVLKTMAGGIVDGEFDTTIEEPQKPVEESDKLKDLGKKVGILASVAAGLVGNKDNDNLEN